MTKQQLHAAIYLDDFWGWVNNAKNAVADKVKQVYADNK